MTGPSGAAVAPTGDRRVLGAGRPGPLAWLRLGLVLDALLLAALAAASRGDVAALLGGGAPPWVLGASGVALAPVVAFLVATGRPAAAPLAGLAAGAVLVATAVLLPPAAWVLAVLWWGLHLAAQPVLLARARRVAGSVFERRLRATGAAVGLLSLAPATGLLPGGVGDVLLVSLLAAGWIAWNGTGRPADGTGGAGATSRALVAIDDQLRDGGDRVLDTARLLREVRRQLGAVSVTLVDEGAVVASTAPEERRWRLLALAALQPGSSSQPTADGGQLLVAETGRGELLVELGATAELFGDAEHDLASWIAQRIGLVLARQETRRRDQQAMASLRAADRMRDDFLATLSHELRTPLTSIRGFSEVLHDNAATLDPEQLRDLLGRVVDNASTLEEMITGLLDLTVVRGRSHPERIATYDLADLVERAVARSRGALRDHGVEVAVPEVRLVTDGGAVLNILEALLDNCAKFTPPGTLVRVEGRVVGDRTELAVADDGPGLPRDLPERVLDPFVRGGDVLTRETRGVGIGLTIAAELARQLEGELVVEAPEVGTRLRLSLPAVHSRHATEAPAASDLPVPARVRAAHASPLVT